MALVIRATGETEAEVVVPPVEVVGAVVLHRPQAAEEEVLLLLQAEAAVALHLPAAAEVLRPPEGAEVLLHLSAAATSRYLLEEVGAGLAEEVLVVDGAPTQNSK